MPLCYRVSSFLAIVHKRKLFEDFEQEKNCISGEVSNLKRHSKINFMLEESPRNTIIYKLFMRHLKEKIWTSFSGLSLAN
jgi:hypothetical protein